MDIKFINAVTPSSDEVYTECDNDECGHFYKLGKVGEICELCFFGVMVAMEECQDEEE